MYLKVSLGLIVFVEYLEVDVKIVPVILILFLGSAKPNALVDFGDEGTSVIRSDKIIEGSINDGKCQVIWSDKEYEADLLFTGDV